MLLPGKIGERYEVLFMNKKILLKIQENFFVKSVIR